VTFNKVPLSLVERASRHSRDLTIDEPMTPDSCI